MYKKDKIMEFLNDEEGYSANEIAEHTGARITTIRSLASRANITIPTLFERVKDLRKQRDDLLDEIEELEK